MEINVRDCGAGRFEVSARDATLIVDRPPSEGGDPAGFRPTELLLAAISTCTASTMRNFADNNGVTGLEGVDVIAVSEEASRPQRVASIHVELRVRGELPDEAIEQLLRVGKHCKIHNTMHRDPEITVELGAREEESTV